MDRLYTVKEVAEILTLDEETVRRYLVNGDIKGIKLNKVWRVDEATLQEFLNERKGR